MDRNTKIKWWQILLGVILLIGIIILVFFLFRMIWHVFAGLQKEVAASLVAASATILVSVFSITWAKYYEKKRVVDQELREKKIPVYQEFVEFILKMLWSEKITGKSMNEKEMEKFLMSFTQKVMLWGSDDVLSQWSTYRQRLIKNTENNQNVQEMMFELEKLLLAIRRDTGHKNKNVKRGSLLGLFINDIEKYI